MGYAAGMPAVSKRGARKALPGLPRQRDALLRESEERFKRLIEISPDTIIVHVEGSIAYINPAGARLLGASSPEELVGRPVLDLVSPPFREKVRDRIRQTLEEGRQTPLMEQKLVRMDGQEVEVEVAGVGITYQGKPATMALIRDISERRRAEALRQRDTLHDSLTNLPNRTLLMDRLGLSMERLKGRRRHKFAILFLDVDRFKIVNDSLGHARGDQLLVAIAERLQSCLRPGDTLARLGGDEFAMLCEEIQGVSEATRVADRIHRAMVPPFPLDGHEVFATMTIGIAVSAAAYERPEDILRDADTAAYRAKTLGKARHEVFDKDMHSHAVALLKLESDLRRAIERREFRLHYQPILSLEDGRIAGFEALVRWQHPERGLLLPAAFLEVAEETGLIVPIGSWVLQEACRQLGAWRASSPPLVMSVNLSSRQASQPDLVQEVGRILKDTGLDPSRLRLEITESVLMEHADSVTESLSQLKALSIQLHIDDFGTGYSSLSYLHRFPLDALKVDRAFIRRIGEPGGRPEILRAIVGLAHNLGMEVVAEGVETQAQLEELKSLRCRYAQGYLFSKPVDSEAAERLITALPP